MLRDGDHVLVLAGTELVRDLHIDPNRRGQPRKPTAPPRSTLSAITRDIRVSDDPRHHRQRGASTVGHKAEVLGGGCVVLLGRHSGAWCCVG